MGKNNRQRRATKARKRRDTNRSHSGTAQSSGPGWSPSGSPLQDDWITPGDRFVMAVHAQQSGDHDIVARLVDQLAGAPRRALAALIARYLEDEVAHAWRHGWQPADLDRIVGRDLTKADVDLVRSVVAGQACTYAALGERVAPGWMEQLTRIDAAPVPDGDRHAYLLDPN